MNKGLIVTGAVLYVTIMIVAIDTFYVMAGTLVGFIVGWKGMNTKKENSNDNDNLHEV